MAVAPRIQRFLGLWRLGFARTLGRLLTGESSRVLLSIIGVAIAVMLMTTVSGISIGLASQSAIQSEDVNYWIVPESGTASSVAVSVGGPALGNVHAVTETLMANDRIQYATPVQTQILQLSARDEREYILVVGAIPRTQRSPSVVGLPTAPLKPGDPYYLNGSYAGQWTGQAVMNDAAAELLNSSEGDVVHVPTGRTNKTFTAVNISEGGLNSGVGPVPVVLVHLSELQAITGTTQSDQADQILVSTNNPGVKSEIESLYPGTMVVTQTGFSTSQLSTSSLPLAIALLSFITSITIGVLCVATMMGLQVTADRQNLAVLAALGYSNRSRSVLVLLETITVGLCGGIVGVGLGSAGIKLTNTVAAHYWGLTAVALFDPLLLGYGLGVAFLIGFLAAPYPIWLSTRTDPVEVLG